MLRVRVAIVALSSALTLLGLVGCGSDDGGTTNAGGDSGTDGSSGTGGATGGTGGTGGTTGGTGGTGGAGSGGVAGSGGAAGSSGAAGSDGGGAAGAAGSDAGGAAGSDAGGAAGSDAGDGGIACNQPSDCPATGSACITATCVANLCGTSFVANGTALSSQTVGDCKQKQCDGAGNEKTVDDGTDVPNDNNDCTVDACTSGTPSNTPKASGSSCGTIGVCNGSGQCVGCNSPSDCAGTDTDCHARTCVSNVCGVSNTAAGTPTTSQTAGDCKQSQCDGSGNIVSANLDTDLPADDGNQCTNEVCTAGVPSHPNSSTTTTCSQNGGSYCDGSGACVACNTASQCPGSDTDCQTRTCVSNVCGVSNTAAGTPTTSQTAGDCKQNQCDGSGNIVSANLDTDLPADDGNQCTGEVCTAGVASHPNLAVGTSCSQSGGSVCDGDGSCVQPFCGDGLVGASEDCDDKNSVETDGCTTQCKDGVVCNATAFPGGDAFAVNAFTGNCYVSFDSEQTTHPAAQTACVNVGGHLVTITSAAEQTLVQSVQNTAENPWIGAVDDANDTDAVFAWVTGEAWSYTHFAAGQPDDDAGVGGNGECLHLLNAAGEWNDTNCSITSFVAGRICEVEIQPCGDKALQAGEECDDGNSLNGDGCSSTCKKEPYFSEYVEGSSNNKAVEIYNPSSTAFDLGANNCSIKLYSNGSATATATVALTGAIAPGDVFVVCNSSSNAGILAVCDKTSSSINFNGDDAVELSCTSTYDVIGQIGFDPGAAWGAGMESTVDHTLQRKCSVTKGDSNGADVFAPATEWVGSAIDTITNLGSAGCAP